MSKHTPGPWTFEYLGEDDSVIWDASHTCVAKVWGGVANARLIAAAPEMLGALKIVIERFGPIEADLIFSKRNALAHVRAVISKAEGK